MSRAGVGTDAPSPVTTLEQLRPLTHAPVSRSLFPAQAPLLRFPTAGEADLRRWQRRFERDLHACGCTAGALMLLGALAGLAVAHAVFGLRLGSVAATVGVWPATALAAALTGKALGLLGARVRRRRLYAEIERTLAGRQDREG